MSIGVIPIDIISMVTNFSHYYLIMTSRENSLSNFNVNLCTGIRTKCFHTDRSTR